MNFIIRPYLELHFSVILWGFTAVLGALIQLPAIDLVWWRCLLTIISLFFLIPYKKIIETEMKLAIRYLLIGMIFGFHWLAFFGSIKLANPTVTLVCMSTCAFFTSLFEPLILKIKFNKYNSFVAVLMISAIYIIFQSVDISFRKGIWMGLLSAALAALVLVLNKKTVDRLDPLRITLMEITGCFLVMMVLKIFDYDRSFLIFPDLRDMALLIFLALACTTFTWILVLKSLKILSAFSISLAVNMEAVYGILLSAFILKDYEKLNQNFFIGAIMIILLVFTYPFLHLFKTSESDI